MKYVTMHMHMHMMDVVKIEQYVGVACSRHGWHAFVGTIVSMATLDKYFTAKEGEWQQRKKEKENKTERKKGEQRQGIPCRCCSKKEESAEGKKGEQLQGIPCRCCSKEESIENTMMEKTEEDEGRGGGGKLTQGIPCASTSERGREIKRKTSRSRSRNRREVQVGKKRQAQKAAASGANLTGDPL